MRQASRSAAFDSRCFDVLRLTGTGATTTIGTQAGRCKAIVCRRFDIEVEFADQARKADTAVALNGDCRVRADVAAVVRDDNPVLRENGAGLLGAIPSLACK